MSAKVNRTWVHQLSRVIRRVRLGSLQELTGVLLGFLSLGIAVWSIEKAKWISPQPSLILVLGLAVLASLLLAKSRIVNIVIHSLMIILGLMVTIWQSTSLFLSTEANFTLGSWWHAVSEVSPSEGTVHFAMFLLFATWLVGFVSTWFILRRRNAWIAVSLGIIMILVNLNNLPRDYYYLFPIYLLVTMLLIGQVNLARQQFWFRKRGINYPHRGIVYFVTAVLLTSVLTVAAAWFVPTTSINQLNLTDTSGPRGANTEEPWFNIFAAVKSKWSLLDSSDLETLFFREPIETGGTIRFVITSEQPGYWRTKRYDTYHSWGWTSNITADHTLNSGAIAEESESPLERDIYTYTVESRLKTDVILTKGEFVSADIPVLLQTLSANVSEANLPASLTGQPTTTETERVDDGEDVMAVVSPRMMGPYQRYEVVAYANSASPDELSEAEEDYPPWIKENYLQLPDTLPVRVRLLSEALTLQTETVYDKVVAIKKFLNKFDYSQKRELSRDGVDGVDFLLFTARQGVCNDFASAMVVMLRSLGVPARLSTGYLRGELDRDTGNYLLRSQNYHAWAEVYFPEYGWIEIEATPASEPEDEEIIVSSGGTFSDLEDLPFWMEGDGPAPPGDISLIDTTRKAQSGLKPYAYIAIIGIPLLLVFVARLIFNRWLHRLKRVKSAREAYHRMCSLALLGKSGPSAHETPLEYSTRLKLFLPAQAEEISNITEAYLSTQYGPRKELEKIEKTSLQKSWVRLCPFLVKHLLRLRRWLVVRIVWSPV